MYPLTSMSSTLDISLEKTDSISFVSFLFKLGWDLAEYGDIWALLKDLYLPMPETDSIYPLASMVCMKYDHSCFFSIGLDSSHYIRSVC